MDDAATQQLEAVPGTEGPARTAPHRPGEVIALRSIRAFPDRGPAVSFAVAGTVLQDDDEFIAVMTRPGSERASRAGRRTGPRGRNVVVAGWDGSFDIAPWEGPAVVRVHPRGRCWLLWRWHDGTDWTQDWYGNLESPWRRSAAGYDTSDWALDVVADGVPGTDDWRVGFKDEDELYWYVAQGAFTPE